MDTFNTALLSLTAMFASFAIHLLFFKSRSGSTGRRLPPGNTGWPKIGESYEFLSTGWKGYPEKFIFDRAAKYSSKVFKTHLFCEKFVMFCGAAGNKFMFSNENKLVQGWWPDSATRVFPSTLQKSSLDETMKMRKTLSSFLKPDALQRYIGIMDQIAAWHFWCDWENRDQVEVFPLCKMYTFMIACRLFLSVDQPAEVAKLLEPFQVLSSGLISVPINLPGTPYNRAIKTCARIIKMLSSNVSQRRIDLAEGKASPDQDIMSHMLTASDENGKIFKQDWEVADKILGLLVAGHDTSSSACTFIVKYLAELPEIYEGVYKEQMEVANSKASGELLNWEDIHKMKYSWKVACEVLRLAPPLQGGYRQALTDFTFNGFSIPKGWKLYWSAHSTHRDPESFPEPLKFDPTRYDGTGPAPYTFVPFGGGPRMCPGEEYARMIILVFMHHLVKRFKWEKIIGDEKIVVNPLPKPAKGLPVRLFPHKA